MKEHPISEILKASIIQLGDLIDVGKVVGSPILLPDQSIAIPLTKVSCGFGV
ncbi:MAG TPA: sporulation protein YtfJ, partial [Candidatus Caccosoma faecigallinarum]|nr:sporulation protein YtfJ [Candidatus Caccosoma faecigallinarum]